MIRTDEPKYKPSCPHMLKSDHRRLDFELELDHLEAKQTIFFLIENKGHLDTLKIWWS